MDVYLFIKVLLYGFNMLLQFFIIKFLVFDNIKIKNLGKSYHNKVTTAAKYTGGRNICRICENQKVNVQYTMIH